MKSAKPWVLLSALRVVRSVTLMVTSLVVLSHAGWAQVQNQAQPIINDHPPKPQDLGPQAPDPSADATQPVPGVPDYVLFHFFFAHLENLEAVAAREEAKGAKDADKWRTHEQRAAQLTQGEGDLLKQVAHRCNEEVKQQEAKISAALKNSRDNNTGGNAAAAPPELGQLFDERQHIINSYVDELKAKLGEDSFAKLTAYIRANFKVRTITIPASSPPSSSSTKPAGGAL